MVGPRASAFLDKLHHATVAVLVVSTAYFGFEAMRASMAIQKHKYEQKRLAAEAPSDKPPASS
ncbi:hypothetical protein HT031_003635 [Scenedesmus sp. PABB004]|nr:hypothetical protein HT031_003635 [Scenedesmus sp. PABB004]